MMVVLHERPRERLPPILQRRSRVQEEEELVLADVAEERPTVRASRADVVDALGIDRSTRRHHSTVRPRIPRRIVCGRVVTVSSRTFGDGTCLAAARPKGLRGPLAPMRRGFLDERLEESPVLALLRVPEDADDEALRRIFERLRRSVRRARRFAEAASELRVALMVVRLHVAAGAEDRGEAGRRQHGDVVVGEDARPSPCGRSCRPDPARAARACRPPRRSAPASPRQIASSGRSRSSAARMSGARNRPARARRRPSRDARRRRRAPGRGRSRPRTRARRPPRAPRPSSHPAARGAAPRPPPRRRARMRPARAPRPCPTPPRGAREVRRDPDQRPSHASTPLRIVAQG